MGTNGEDKECIDSKFRSPIRKIRISSAGAAGFR